MVSQLSGVESKSDLFTNGTVLFSVSVYVVGLVELLFWFF